MELWEEIVTVYPELADNNFDLLTKNIVLQDDSDGVGAYIREWNYSKPIPDGLTLGKPNA
jgi:hypothetical protein